MARQLLNDDLFPVTEADLELTIPIDKDPVYWLRPLTVEKLREFSRKWTRRKPNKRTHQMDDVTDNTALANECLDYVVAKWEGVFDNGALAKCDLEHKLRLPDEVQQALVAVARSGPSPEDKARSLRGADTAL